MLLVRTRLGQSRATGRIGLIADENIRKDTLICVFDPKYDMLILPDSMAKFSDLATEFVRKYGYRHLELDKYVLSVDNARFFNHSGYPNTYRKKDGDYALRNILRGDELTRDFHTFDRDVAVKLYRGSYKPLFSPEAITDDRI